MDAKTHALNIKTLRESRYWSQEELAISSGVDVRTIQRAESGSRPMSVETLRAIAAAFDTTIEALSLSQEDLAAAVEAFHKTHKVIPLDAVESGPDLSRFLATVEAFQFERIGTLSDEQLAMSTSGVWCASVIREYPSARSRPPRQSTRGAFSHRIRL